MFAASPCIIEDIASNSGSTCGSSITKLLTTCRSESPVGTLDLQLDRCVFILLVRFPRSRDNTDKQWQHCHPPYAHEIKGHDNPMYSPSTPTAWSILIRPWQSGHNRKKSSVFCSFTYSEPTPNCLWDLPDRCKTPTPNFSRYYSKPTPKFLSLTLVL